MAEPRILCEPWFDYNTLPNCCPEPVFDTTPCDPNDPPDAPVYPLSDEDYALMASEILFRLTGLKYPGLCEVTVRPCIPCGCHSNCCCEYESFRLKSDYPITDVLNVTIDGNVFADWRLDDWGTLVRTDGERWPTCQKLEDDLSQVDTFSVTFVTGRTPPIALVLAAQYYACELKKACNDPSNCELPDGVRGIVRQGVSMQLSDPSDLVRNGMTGVQRVDELIAPYVMKYTHGTRIYHPTMNRGIRFIRENT